MALSRPKPTKTYSGERTVPKVYNLKVKAGAKIFAGALVALQGGFAIPATVATGLIVVGIAQKTADNTNGGNGAIKVKVHAGVAKLKNSASTDAIGDTEMGLDVFMVDDETVAKTNGSNTRSRAGKVVEVESDGVWVLSGIGV